MRSVAVQTARLELRTTPERKKLIERAAELEGRSLTDFVLTSVYESAKRTIHDHETMTFSTRDRDAFVSALLNPSTPAGALAAAAKRHKKAILA